MYVCILPNACARKVKLRFFREESHWHNKSLKHVRDNSGFRVSQLYSIRVYATQNINENGAKSNHSSPRTPSGALKFICRYAIVLAAFLCFTRNYMIRHLNSTASMSLEMKFNLFFVHLEVTVCTKLIRFFSTKCNCFRLATAQR